MWRIKCLIGFWGVLLLFGCNKTKQLVPIGQDQILAHTAMETGNRRLINNPCNAAAHYTELDRLNDTKIIRVNFHLMNASNGSKNFRETDGYAYVAKLVNDANRALADNQKMWLPLDNKTPVLPTGYRYVLTTSEGYENERGVYCHYDEDLYYYVATGRNKNNYNKQVIQKYAIGLDSILNVFMMPHHPDSIISKDYSVTQSGIALGNAIKLTGIYESKKATWAIKGLLNHEIGHVMTLRHSWSGNDGCNDTPNNPNCWNKSDNPPCDTRAGNNLMDYNANQNAWTPCQIGKIHSVISRHGSRQRGLVIKDWCMLQPDKNIVISDTVVWRGARDIKGNIIVEEGSYLHLQCRVSLPKSARIILKKNARLHLGKNAWLHNDCGFQWEGIFVDSESKSNAQILKEEGAKITDNQRTISID